MKTTRPTAVTIAFLLVLLQIAIAVTASVIAAFAPADYKTYAVTTPVFLVVLFAAVAYYLWVGRPWARAVTMVVAALAVIGDLSVVLYYDHTATVTANVIGLILAAAILILLLLPTSKLFFQRTQPSIQSSSAR
jgi:peptidoglycan/LPS O-acetylase OafA/YrhL